MATTRLGRGLCVIEDRGLPADAETAAPVFAELLRLWQPRHASWTTDDIRLLGRRRGLGAGRPRLGMLTWVRDDIPSPFVGGEQKPLGNGTLYRFGDSLDEMTEDVADRVVKSSVAS